METAGAKIPPDASMGRHIRAILTLGLPLAGSHVAQVAIGATDTLMLGRYGVEELAAVTLGSSFFGLVLLVGSGFAWAVIPLVASATAKEGGGVEARRVTRMGLWISGLYAVGLMIPMLLSETLFLAAGQEPRTSELAGVYLNVAGFGLFPALFAMTLKSYLSAVKAARAVFQISLAAVFVNAGLNYVLIFGPGGLPELGLLGAAVGSVLTHILTFAGLAVVAARVTPGEGLFVRLWRPDWEKFRRVLALGLPISGATLAEAGLFSASAVMMGWLGTVPLAAHGVVLQLASLMFVLHVGLSNAATVEVGVAHATDDRLAMRRLGIASIFLSALVALGAVALFLGVPEPILRAFTDASDPRRPEILATGATLLAMAALFQLFDGTQVIGLGLLRGVQDTNVPMWVTVVAYWCLGLPASYVMGFTLGWGGVGVWGGLAVGLAFAAALLLWRFFRKFT